MKQLILLHLTKRFGMTHVLALGLCMLFAGLVDIQTAQANSFSEELTNDVYQQTVSGTIIDGRTGEPLPGVNILISGTGTGTTTDVSGNYELSVPTLNETLVVSYIGYETQNISIDGRTEINIEMQSSMYRGDELVVVGYGVQRRSDIAGSVGVVSREDLEQPAFNTLQSLRGKVAGVNIFTNSGSPTGSNRVIIRGVGTINASPDPLYVVDGVVMENIEFMNPNDIESIEVLKDATATAIYGARGANGVILITTQRGGDEGIVVGYNADFSVGRMRGKMDVLNAEEFMEVQRIGMENAPLWTGGAEPVFDPSDPRLFDAQGNPLYDTDWQEEATRTAVSHNHQFSVQYGGERSSFGAFLNYTDREGIFLNSYMDRVNLKLVYDANPTEWLSVGSNLSIGRVSENNIEEGGGGTTARRTIIEFPPIFPVTWEDGTYPDATQIEGNFSFESQTNPVHILLESDRLRDRTLLFGNTYLAFQVTENLEFRTQLGIDNTLMEVRNYCPVGMFSCGGNPDGNAYLENSETMYWQNENFLTYMDDFGPHRVSSVLGASWQQRDYRSNWSSATGFSDDFFRFNNIGTATNPNPPGSTANDWTMSSYFTRTSYTYDDTYSATFTARLDGSSRFGANSKYGFFPSLGASWMVTNEDFMSGLSFIDHLRLRSSYGVTGNTEIGLYQSLATVGSGTSLIGGTRQAVSFPQRLPNPDLEWEKTYMFNIGGELNLFNETFLIEADYYHKLTEDLLLNRPIPMTTGFSSITDNIGSVSNRGIDLLITTRNIRSADFIWTTTLNFNYNKNRIESLGVEDEDIFPGPFWVSGSQTILRVGESIGTFWGFERLGTWDLDEADEAAAVGRVPGEAKRSDEQTIIGNGLPDFTGSFINRFNLGNFDATIDLQFSYGADIMQQFLHSSEDRMGLTSGLSTQYHDSWTPDNQDTMIQRIRHFSFAGQNSQADSHWIVDGSYIRGNLFSVGYTFDPGTLASIGLSHLRVTANLENAFVIHSSDFKGYDPEATSWGGNTHAQNIFFYQYPKPRTFSIGVDLRF
jgi:TonB-dependent starch-binding outer membrane protein SusC